VLQKESSSRRGVEQAAGAAFIEKAHATRRKIGGAQSRGGGGLAQVAAFSRVEQVLGDASRILKRIQHPTLVVNGVFDEMIPVSNSYELSAQSAECCCLLTFRTPRTALSSSSTESFYRQVCGIPGLGVEIRPTEKRNPLKPTLSRSVTHP